MLIFEYVFDGTLGSWQTETVSFKVKQKEMTYEEKVWPGQKLHKKELE